MALPAQVLKKNRAIGMGIFFTIYYLGMGVFPVIAGYARDVTGNPATPLILAGVAILIAVPEPQSSTLWNPAQGRDDSNSGLK